MKTVFILLLLSLNVSAQYLDTPAIDEDKYDLVQPFLLANNRIKGLNIKKFFQKGDTGVYWILVADTLGRGPTPFVSLKRLPSQLKFYPTYVLRAYGLNRSSTALGNYVELFDATWRVLSRDSLLILRILQDTIRQVKTTTLKRGFNNETIVKKQELKLHSTQGIKRKEDN